VDILCRQIGQETDPQFYENKRVSGKEGRKEDLLIQKRTLKPKIGRREVGSRKIVFQVVILLVILPQQ
jgi:hypothetical protein